MWDKIAKTVLVNEIAKAFPRTLVFDTWNGSAGILVSAESAIYTYLQSVLSALMWRGEGWFLEILIEIRRVFGGGGVRFFHLCVIGRILLRKSADGYKRSSVRYRSSKPPKKSPPVAPFYIVDHRSWCSRSFQFRTAVTERSFLVIRLAE